MILWFYKNSYPNGNLGVLGCGQEGRQDPFVLRNEKSISDSQQDTEHCHDGHNLVC